MRGTAQQRAEKERSPSGQQGIGADFIARAVLVDFRLRGDFLETVISTPEHAAWTVLVACLRNYAFLSPNPKKEKNRSSSATAPGCATRYSSATKAELGCRLPDLIPDR